MRWSQMHIPTLRDDPADADAVSHRLLLRAGFIRQMMAGHYSLLPLGIRTRAKVMAIIREEMNRIGAQEFLMPSMQPAQLWEKSGRLAVMGDEMFRLKDRKGSDMVLGMTHEEIFTTLAVELASYRELPQFWYQFQTKFRDEPRPRAGLLRVRGKGGGEGRLPLPADVGEAIAAYLRDGRPRAESRAVFLTLLAPVRPIGSCSVGDAVARG